LAAQTGLKFGVMSGGGFCLPHRIDEITLGPWACQSVNAETVRSSGSAGPSSFLLSLGGAALLLFIFPGIATFLPDLLMGK
jgi:hypothetical protein